MRVRFASRIVIRVFTLLVMTASLATNVGVSATVNDQPLSPRLLALRDRLASGDRTALDKFWNEINEQGAPIIESAADSDHEMLVTMLWRAREETKNVFVFRLGDVSKPMTRLLDTDLWYKTFRIQKGARFIYQFATNLPDPKEWGGITRFAGALRNDPLNPLQYVERVNEFNPYEVTFTSAVELASAEPQTWNDGGVYVNTARVTTILDNLIGAGLIPSLIAVMVENPDRWRELSCSSAYADFLAQEIVPWAR